MSATDPTGTPDFGRDPAPLPPHAGVSRTPLVRRGDNRIIAGVAGGLADAMRIDATVVRIAFVVLSLLGGTGIVLYLLGWALMPEEGETESAAERAVRRVGGMSTGAQIALAVLAVVLLVNTSPGLFATVALVAIAVVLLGRQPSGNE